MNQMIATPMGNTQQSPIPNPYFNNYAPVSAQTPFYPQPLLPAGMVYLINSPQELSTIPTQAGLHLYWCGKENKIYVRNFANGMLEQKEFFISDTNPINTNNSNGAQMVGIDAIEDIPTELFNKLDTRLSSIERQLKNIKGGDVEWQL